MTEEQFFSEDINDSSPSSSLSSSSLFHSAEEFLSDEEEEKTNKNYEFEENKSEKNEFNSLNENNFHQALLLNDKEKTKNNRFPELSLLERLVFLSIHPSSGGLPGESLTDNEVAFRVSLRVAILSELLLHQRIKISKDSPEKIKFISNEPLNNPLIDSVLREKSHQLDDHSLDQFVSHDLFKATKKLRQRTLSILQSKNLITLKHGQFRYHNPEAEDLRQYLVDQIRDVCLNSNYNEIIDPQYSSNNNSNNNNSNNNNSDNENDNGFVLLNEQEGRVKMTFKERSEAFILSVLLIMAQNNKFGQYFHHAEVKNAQNNVFSTLKRFRMNSQQNQQRSDKLIQMIDDIAEYIINVQKLM